MRRAPALSFLLVTVFLDMLGLGLVVPIMPALLSAVTEDAGAAVRWSGLLGSVYGLLQFVVSPLLGRLSDRYGRRPVLLVSLSCLGIDWLAHAISPSPWTLLLFHALAGACAGTYTVVNAYLADVTAPEARARAYGLVGAAFGLGFVAGPTIGGLLGAVDVRLPFLAAAALSLANVGYGWLDAARVAARGPDDPVDPADGEPGQRHRRRPASTGARPARVRPALRRRRPDDPPVDLDVLPHPPVRLGHRAGRRGAGGGGAAGALFQARAVGPIVRRLGDKRAAVAGGVLGVAALAGTAFVRRPGCPPAPGGRRARLGRWRGRAVVALPDRPADEQGTVQGALTGIGAAAETVVPVLAGTAFAWSLDHASPGLVFAGAAVFAAGSTLLLATTPDLRRP